MLLIRDFTGYFENERQVKYKLEDDPSGITTGALLFCGFEVY